MAKKKGFNLKSVDLKNLQKTYNENKKVFWIAGGVILLLLLLLIFWPSGEVQPAPEIEQAQEIKAVDTTIPDSYRSRTTATGKMTLTEGTKITPVSFTMNSIGFIDEINKRSQVDLNIDLSSPNFERPIKLTTTSYIVDDTIYQKMTFTGLLDEYWIKIDPASSEKLLDQVGGAAVRKLDVQNELKDNFELIDNSEITLVDEKTRKYRLEPDKAMIGEIADKVFQTLVSSVPEVKEYFNVDDYTTDFEKGLKKIEVNFWLDEQKRVTKIESVVDFAFDKTSIIPKRPTVKDITSLTMSIKLVTDISQYNSVKPITLPAEAQQALTLDEFVETVARRGFAF